MAVKGAILGDVLGSPYKFKRVRIRVPATVQECPVVYNPVL